MRGRSEWQHCRSGPTEQPREWKSKQSSCPAKIPLGIGVRSEQPESLGGECAGYEQRK